jgi:hypothetical protein
MCIEEYELLPPNSQEKKNLQNTIFFLINPLKVALIGEKTSLKQKFSYHTKIKDFKQFQMQTFIHRNMPTTTPGLQSTIETAYMVIDYATNTKNLPFKKAQKILNDLNILTFTIFQTYHSDSYSESNCKDYISINNRIKHIYFFQMLNLLECVWIFLMGKKYDAEKSLFQLYAILFTPPAMYGFVTI